MCRVGESPGGPLKQSCEMAGSFREPGWREKDAERDSDDWGEGVWGEGGNLGNMVITCGAELNLSGDLRDIRRTAWAWSSGVKERLKIDPNFPRDQGNGRNSKSGLEQRMRKGWVDWQETRTLQFLPFQKPHQTIALRNTFT